MEYFVLLTNDFYKKEVEFQCNLFYTNEYINNELLS